MQISSRFTIAVHMMTCMENLEKLLTEAGKNRIQQELS